MNKLSVIPSFSGLLSQIKSRKVSFGQLNDPDTICYFGCTKKGIQKTVENMYDKKDGSYQKIWDELEPILAAAEYEGRVLWRLDYNCSYDDQFEKPRRWLASHVESRGGSFSERSHLSNVHNIPAIWSYLQSVIGLEIAILDFEFAWRSSEAPNH